MAWSLCSDGRCDVDPLAVAKAAADRFELDHTIGQREEGVVLAMTDIDAGQH